MSTQERSGSGDRRTRRTQKTPPRNTAPEVVYSQAKPFNRSRLILRIVTIVAVVLAIGLGLSVFFKVDTIEVSGTDKYSAWTISEASGIEKGDSLVFFGRAAAGGKIINALPYVKSVRFDITLPGTIHIIIEEAPVAYSIQASDDSWWLITADGRVAEQVDSEKAEECTTIIGVRLHNPQAGEQAVAAEPAAPADTPVVITGDDRLQVALQILQQLEANEILGEAASVNVSNLQTLELWYGSRFQVKLGDSDRLDYKIEAVKQAIAQMSQYQTGILDASFTTFPDKVHFSGWHISP